jgi:hypothetical protein
MYVKIRCHQRITRGFECYGLFYLTPQQPLYTSKPPHVVNGLLKQMLGSSL